MAHIINNKATSIEVFFYLCTALVTFKDIVLRGGSKGLVILFLCKNLTIYSVEQYEKG
jgi:putative effector of murein hydrolase LrgA (UPF0299 family)